ncbi:DinB family protein [Chitinophaga sp. CC14]|uniref:DinB family protein n=1 Tax=Chitinophaga sp. CC14 TaxID=3029199 RepID=UPI003B7B46EB
MKTFFKEIFEYNYNINQKLGDAYNTNTDKISDKAQKLYSHILNAHQIWNNRIEARRSAFGVWENHAIHEFRDIDKANHEHTFFIIDTLDLNSTVNYTKGGKTFNKKICELLFHVINHSTYHRGQIATEFKQNGLDPLATDYILYEKK